MRSVVVVGRPRPEPSAAARAARLPMKTTTCFSIDLVPSAIQR